MKTILSIDGGGIRGRAPAEVLARLEKTLGQPLADVCDLAAGTSTGGILVTALGAGVPAHRLPILYDREAHRIFDRPFGWKLKTGWSLWGPKYPSDGLMAALRAHLPAMNYYDQATGLDVMVTAFDLRSEQMVFLKSWRSGYLDNRIAAYATAAAPTFFPPKHLLRHGKQAEFVDGGVGASNPAMAAVAEARRRWPGQPLTILSLGTGRYTEPAARRTKWWGLPKWAPVIHEVLLSAQADTTSYYVEHSLRPGDFFVRLGFTMPRDIPMDTTREEDLEDLARWGEQMAESDDFSRFVAAVR